MIRASQASIEECLRKWTENFQNKLASYPNAYFFTKSMFRASPDKFRKFLEPLFIEIF